MRLGRVIKTIIVWIVVGAFVPASFAEDSLEDRIKKLEELVAEQGEIIRSQQETIKWQGQQINKMQEHECDIHKKLEEHEKQLETFKVMDKDVSERLKGQLERMESIGPVDIGAGMTFIGQGTPNANAAGSDGNGGTDSSRFDGSYSADIEIAKQFDDAGLAFVHLEAGDGDSLEGDLSLYPRTGVNRDADRSGNAVAVTEAWYEQYLFDNQLIITGGKLDATSYIDTNEFANDETTQFLGHLFRNAPTIEFPDNNIGARAYYTCQMFPAFDIGAVYMEGDGNWDEVFRKPFAAVQLSFMPEKFFEDMGEAFRGKYRGYFWYNGTDHTQINDASKTKEVNYGFGFSGDQNLTETFGIFERFGWQNPKVSTIEYHWSVGARMLGTFWNREDDVLAVGVGQAIPGKQYSDNNENDKVQTHLEAYYSIKVNDYLTISPDTQVIWDPNGSSEDGYVFVYGARGQVDF